MLRDGEDTHELLNHPLRERREFPPKVQIARREFHQRRLSGTYAVQRNSKIKDVLRRGGV